VNQQKSRWRRIGSQILWAVGVVVAVSAVAFVINDFFFHRQLWDWLKLLIVPVMLALVGYLFSLSQNQATEEATQERARDEALQAYLDKMAELLIDENLHEKANEYDKTRITARARTLAVLRRLDGERKKTVLLFLREARLINRYDYFGPEKGPYVLYYAHYVGLEDADLSEADLERARLISTSEKVPISLKGANLKGAKLRGAELRGADLREAILRGADLREADLSAAKLSVADLSKTDLKLATLRNADPAQVDLSGADLFNANLRNADLRNVNLEEANLLRADLSGADLRQDEAMPGRMSEEEVKRLTRQAASLKGATMPNGQKYEDWLKSRDSGKDR
jgi:uncharacterized protein YjbI with pentapeptide repeats